MVRVVLEGDRPSERAVTRIRLAHRLDPSVVSVGDSSRGDEHDEREGGFAATEGVVEKLDAILADDPDVEHFFASSRAAPSVWTARRQGHQVLALFNWTDPLFPAEMGEARRLREAACWILPDPET